MAFQSDTMSFTDLEYQLGILVEIEKYEPFCCLDGLKFQLENDLLFIITPLFVFVIILFQKFQNTFAFILSFSI